MGTLNAKNASLGDALFSKTQQQVLGLTYGKPDRSFYAKEIVRHAGIGIGTVQRELEKLSRAGILTVNKIGNQKHYQANRESPIFKELCGLVLKTFGLSHVLKKGLEDLAERIDAAFIFGSVAKGADHASSDVDVMVISDMMAFSDLMPSVHLIESELGRTVNVKLYSTKEFRQRVTTESGFVKRVMEQPKIFLIGNEDDIPKS